MTKRWILTPITILGLLAAGCDASEDPGTGQAGSSGENDDDGSDGDDDDGMPSSDTDPEGQTNTTEPMTETESDTEPPFPPDETDGCVFICTDTDTGGGECDLWDQDCMDGEKCNPWANDGGNSWNSSRCAPVDSGPGQPGDACTAEGSGVSGLDSCDAGSMCWNTDEENSGVCVALCQGSEQNPVCDDPSTACIIANDGFLPLCLPVCDPLLQDCAQGEACYPGDNGFVCAPDASGPELGAFGDPCEYTNACDPSLVCVGAAAFPACDNTRCCTNFCDLGDPEPSSGCGGVAGGQECISFFAEGQAPPGTEDVGFCAIPE